MIKRRFYKDEHGDRNDPSDSSSSSSDSELEAVASEDDAVAEVKENDESCSTSSGYESEDSSGNEIDDDSPGLINEDDDNQIHVESPLSDKHGSKILKTKPDFMAEKESVLADMPAFILKCKSVFRCKICPRIVCLTEETMRAHLSSKRHTRSEKLLKEGRLKAMLNSDGELEYQETPAEMHARIVAIAQKNPRKKRKGRQRQRMRSRRKKVDDDTNMGKAKPSTKSPAKKRHKSEQENKKTK